MTYPSESPGTYSYPNPSFLLYRHAAFRRGHGSREKAIPSLKQAWTCQTVWGVTRTPICGHGTTRQLNGSYQRTVSSSAECQRNLTFQGAYEVPLHVQVPSSLVSFQAGNMPRREQANLTETLRAFVFSQQVVPQQAIYRTRYQFRPPPRHLPLFLFHPFVPHRSKVYHLLFPLVELHRCKVRDSRIWRCQIHHNLPSTRSLPFS